MIDPKDVIDIGNAAEIFADDCIVYITGSTARIVLVSWQLISRDDWRPAKVATIVVPAANLVEIVAALQTARRINLAAGPDEQDVTLRH
jgi:hypothetical protein